MIRHLRFTRLLIAGSLVLPAAPLALAQQPRGLNSPPQAGSRQGNDLAGRSDANRPADGQRAGNEILRGSQIIGATVDLRGGSRLGTVQDFVVGDGGCVEYVVAAYGDQFVPIPWAAAMYQPGQRVLLVDIDAGRLHEMPMYRQFSDLSNHQFTEKVQTFYHGVNGRTGNMNQRGAVDHQGANNAARPEAQNAPARPAGAQRTAGNRTGHSERPENRR